MKYPTLCRPISFVLCATLLLGLSACGNKDGKPAATQVAAKVGSEEISVHQINQVLSRSNAAGSTPAEVQAASREVLEKLIDQQLAVSQAIENKLDRSPEIVSALEAAKRDILARAYIQKVAGTATKASADEVPKYYAAHPELFSARRIFNIQEILVPASPGMLEQLRSMAAAGKTTEEVAAWLKGKDIKFGGGNATRPAEQIPLELLTKVHALKDGQNLVLDTPQSITFLHLAASQSAPVDQAAALPRIEQFLNNQRATEVINADIKRLKASTSITYMGEFAKSDVSPPLVAQSPTPNTPAAPMDKAQSAIEKGVAGLK
jgi:EpsD family peptidyl-prolyl cis-trans isomerase